MSFCRNLTLVALVCVSGLANANSSKETIWDLIKQYGNGNDVIVKLSRPSETEGNKIDLSVAMERLKSLVGKSTAVNCRISEFYLNGLPQTVLHTSFDNVEKLTFPTKSDVMSVNILATEANGLTRNLLGTRVKNSDPITYQTLSIYMFDNSVIGRADKSSFTILKVSYLEHLNGELEVLEIHHQVQIPHKYYTTKHLIDKASNVCQSRPLPRTSSWGMG